EPAVAAWIAPTSKAGVPVAVTPKPTTDKTDLYVCTGCGIGDAVDAGLLAALGDEALKRPGHVAGPLCIPEGVAALRDGLAAAEAGRVVIAACSERVNHDVFSPASLGVNMVGRVNIRELVAWSKPPGEHETQLLAEDYVRMGIQRLLWSRKPDRQERDIETALLVVGGGISGLTAALEAANAGHDVHLVERRAELGGWTARFPPLFPTRPPYRELEPVRIDELIDAVVAHPRITVHTGAEITAVAGEPGGLEVTLDQGGTRTDFSFGTNVLDMASLKHALYATEAGARAYVIYEDMVTPGLYESFYRRVSEQPGVYFTNGRVKGIEADGAGGLLVRLGHSLLGED